MSSKLTIKSLLLFSIVLIIVVAVPLAFAHNTNSSVEALTDDAKSNSNVEGANSNDGALTDQKRHATRKTIREKRDEEAQTPDEKRDDKIVKEEEQKAEKAEKNYKRPSEKEEDKVEVTKDETIIDAEPAKEKVKNPLPSNGTNTAELAQILKERASQSYKESEESYHPDPHQVANEFTVLVDKQLMHGNKSRRHLTEGPETPKACLDTSNPIDCCWRCDPNWANNRKRLADCACGFGHGTTGGKAGRYYLVTDKSDDNMEEPKPGTLRHAVIQTEPLWIIFSHSMVICLQQELMFNNDKTIDGRGVQVHIAFGAGLTIQFVHNIIIHNIWIHDIVPRSGGMIRDQLAHVGLRTASDGDAISIFGSNHVWLDHLSLSKGADGLIDVIEGSTAVTISNCKFNHHNDVMLLGAHQEDSIDSIMQVTIAFNRFGERLTQRMPRVRWGFAHVVNNDYSRWELYAIGGSAHPTIISQGNRFRAGNTQYKQVTKRDYAPKSEWIKWQWRSEGDLFKNGAYFVESGEPLKKSPLEGENRLKFKPSKFVGMLTKNAGALRCLKGKICCI